MDWSEDRRRLEFGALEGITYLDHAFRGPVPKSSADATVAALEDAQRGSLARFTQNTTIETTRARVAGLIGWPSESVGFVANTTGAVAAIAGAIGWRAGDRILVGPDEAPANILPWKALERQGVSIEVLPSRNGRLETGDVESAFGRAGFRLFTCAAVTLGSGDRRDLAALGRLCTANGVFFCVDGVQALGALSLDLSGVDALCGSGRKWLLGPPEVGILALRPGLELEPLGAGGGSVDATGALRLGALRFEGGALPAPTLAGLGVSCGMLAELGLDLVEARVLALAEETRGRARECDLPVLSQSGERASGIVQLDVTSRGADDAELEEALRRKGVAVRILGGRLRVSAHFWNTSADLEALFAALG